MGMRAKRQEKRAKFAFFLTHGPAVASSISAEMHINKLGSLRVITSTALGAVGFTLWRKHKMDENL